jgi:hypothetical protein
MISAAFGPGCAPAEVDGSFLFVSETFFDESCLGAFSKAHFGAQGPYPWKALDGLLTKDRFDLLLREFPSLELFEFHHGLDRNYGQRPHDRYYLAYEKSLYHSRSVKKEKGVVRKDTELSTAWISFVQALKTDPGYRAFIREALGTDEYEMRFAWHIGVTASEVSPHLDSETKLGTHIFYFNTPDDWNESWGGAFLVLSELKAQRMDPDFTDFEGELPVSVLGNKSVIFKNTPRAWHGVRKLTCPPEKHRRLFNVIFEKRPPLWRKVARNLRSYLSQ